MCTPRLSWGGEETLARRRGGGGSIFWKTRDKRIVDEFPDFDIFIISPVTRYVANPCCTNTNHVTNFGDPDFLSSIISDLTKLKFQLRKKLQSAVIIDGIELCAVWDAGEKR